MKDYENKTNEELIDIIRRLSSEGTSVRAYQAMKYQIDIMIEYLDENPLASKATIGDKDDKTWDRGQKLFDKLPEYVDKLKAAELNIAEVKSKYTEKAAADSPEGYLERYGIKKPQ